MRKESGPQRRVNVSVVLVNHPAKNEEVNVIAEISEARCWAKKTVPR